MHYSLGVIPRALAITSQARFPRDLSLGPEPPRRLLRLSIAFRVLLRAERPSLRQVGRFGANIPKYRSKSSASLYS